MMPALITFLSFSFPAGLVLYWIMNNLFSLGQHYLVGHLGKMKEEQGLEHKETAIESVKEEKKVSNKESGKNSGKGSGKSAGKGGKQDK